MGSGSEKNDLQVRLDLAHTYKLAYCYLLLLTIAAAAAAATLFFPVRGPNGSYDDNDSRRK